jgi:LacI family transcriptional regulator
MATIKQIAQKAGVSPTTVSNVLHGNTAKVSPATRKKIQAIIREEKYAPNMGAIILAHSNSRIIGVIIFQEPRRNETVLEDPFSATILGAIEHEIRVNGYFMMLQNASDEDEVVRLCRTWKLDGLILLWVPEETSRIIKRSIETPVVFIDCYFTDKEPGYHNVGLDDRRGGYEMARYLLSMGHTRVLFLANAKIIPGGDLERFEGCRQAFLEQGLSLGDECFIPLSKDVREREAFYKQLISEPLPFSSLFFSADYYAAEAISYFQDQGIDVPERISVVGFDDNIFSRLIQPRLTTVHQDVYLKGQTAVSMLMRIIKGEPVPIEDIRLPVSLRVRDSVRRI